MRQSHSRGQLSPTPRKICDKVRVCLLTRDEVTPLGPRQGCAAAWFRGLPWRGEFWGQCGRERPAKPGEQVSSQRPRHAEGVRALQKAVEPAGPPPPPACGGGPLPLERPVGWGREAPVWEVPAQEHSAGRQNSPFTPWDLSELCPSPGPALPETQNAARLSGTARDPGGRLPGAHALGSSCDWGTQIFLCLEPKVPRRELRVPVPCLEPNGSCLSCDPHGAETSSCPLSRCPASVPAGSPGNAHRTVAPPGPLGGVQ